MNSNRAMKAIFGQPSNLSGLKVLLEADITSNAYQMSVFDQDLLFDDTGGVVAITLPRVGEAKGRVYTIAMGTTDDGDLTISDGGESVDWTDVVLTAVLDRACLYSNGYSWYVLVDLST